MLKFGGATDGVPGLGPTQPCQAQKEQGHSGVKDQRKKQREDALRRVRHSVEPGVMGI